MSTDRPAEDMAEDTRNALALLECYARKDRAGMAIIAEDCDWTGVSSSLCGLLIGLAERTGTDLGEWLAHVRELHDAHDPRELYGGDE